MVPTKDFQPLDAVVAVLMVSSNSTFSPQTSTQSEISFRAFYQFVSD